jgi:hypothetical protein
VAPRHAPLDICFVARRSFNDRSQKRMGDRLITLNANGQPRRVAIETERKFRGNKLDR